MSKYDYPNWHEIKDLAMIYHEDEWDDARITIWDPIHRRNYRLIFSGSTRPEEDHEWRDGKEGEITFTIWPEKETFWDELCWKATNLRIKLIVKWSRIQKKLLKDKKIKAGIE